MLTQAEHDFFIQEQALHEAKYRAGTNPRQQSGFGRDERDWERFRRAGATSIDRDGSFLDIGCANGLLMESVVTWAREGGYRVEPSGLDISENWPSWPGGGFRSGASASSSGTRSSGSRRPATTSCEPSWSTFRLRGAVSMQSGFWSDSSRGEDGSSSARTAARGPTATAPSPWSTRSVPGEFRSTASTTW
jgi:hypothetical protein